MLLLGFWKRLWKASKAANKLKPEKWNFNRLSPQQNTLVGMFSNQIKKSKLKKCKPDETSNCYFCPHSISKVRFNHKYKQVQIPSQIDVSRTVSGKWSNSSHWLWQTAHQGFTGWGWLISIYLQKPSSSLNHLHYNTYLIYTTTLKCVHIYLVQCINIVFTKTVIFSEILDSPLNLSPCIRLWVGGIRSSFENTNNERLLIATS